MLTDFAVTRQDKPDNCAAVAMHNALRWLGIQKRIPPVSQIEEMIANGSQGHDKGRYIEPAWAHSLHYWVDVLIPALKPSQWTEDNISGLLADGWVLVTAVNPQGGAGDRHAVVVVAPGLTVLDGLRSGAPVTMACEEFQHRHATQTMALRLPRWSP